ncbi:MAG: SGNH/GDSL hydrolase family protein [Candidatus Solibacter sp.]
MQIGRCRWVVLAIGLAGGPWLGAAKDAGEHWVATWATSQQLTAGGNVGGRGGGRGAPAVPPVVPPATATVPPAAPRPPQAGRGAGPNASNLPASFADQTVRQIVHVSLGGRRVRVELSNAAGAPPLEVGAAHLAIHKGGGEIAGGSDRVLTFGGSASIIIQPGVLVVSDPVELEVAPLAHLAISLYLPRETGAPTNHNIGLHTAYIAKGNVAGAASLPDATTMFAYVWLSSVDVAAEDDAFTVVAYGDSITDGYATTRDADTAWPYLLARRLSANKATRHAGVVNQGISGNQVLRDGAGLSALARFERDVLSRPGVKWVILLEGINDINIRGRADGPGALTAEELIWGYRQIIARSHAAGIKVMGATIMPEEGVPTASERGEGIRQAANQWIRAKGNFDAVVDFDAVVRDPQRPAHIKAEFDPGDHIHPNDAGNQAMADAFDLRVFR